MITHDDAIALFARRRDAWLRQDLEGYLALWAPDMRFRSPVHREPLDRAAFTDLVRRSFAASRPLEFEFAAIATDGDTVLAEWRIAVERRDGGRRIEWWGMSTAVIRDGLIATWREYWNPADVV
jgi:limonene-1,2-epoxide hydrolase